MDDLFVTLYHYWEKWTQETADKPSELAELDHLRDSFICALQSSGCPAADNLPLAKMFMCFCGGFNKGLEYDSMLQDMAQERSV